MRVQLPVKDIYDIVRLWTKHPNEPCALATLVRAHGSSYRRPGARMLFCANGDCAGTLSGGCLEDEVAISAGKIIRGGTALLIEFDTRRLFGCHGSIEIFVERADTVFLREVAQHLAARRELSLATTFQNDATVRGTNVLSLGQMARDGDFVQQIEPAIRLIIFGNGPESAPLRSLAETLGWSIVEAEQASELPQEIDRWTAAIVKSHNYGRDYAALQHFLPLELPYVGIIGPRKRRDQFVLDRGISVNATVFAPAGLNLGSETPEEIALSIVAEIQTVFAGGTRESLRDSKAPIHAVRNSQITAVPR